MIGGSLVFGSQSGSSKTTSAAYKPSKVDIQAARRLLWGNILQLFGGSPYGSADLSGANPGSTTFDPQYARYAPTKPAGQPRLRDAMSLGDLGGRR